MPEAQSWLAARVRSFRFAGRGVAELLRCEPNARIHLAAAVAVVGLARIFGVSRGEWLALLLAMGLVFVAEASNTAVEEICDLVSPGEEPRVARAKDVAAGAVLLASIAAAAVGLLVLGPPLLDWLHSLL